MSNILFIDNTCPKPYDFKHLREEGLGGTEATLLRVSRGLAKNHSVYVLQHNRGTADEQDGVNFITLETMMPNPDIVVHLRVCAHVPLYKNLFTKSRHYAWMHDLATDYYATELDVIEQLDGIIYVSEFHKRQFEQHLKGIKFDLKLPEGHVLYNIVEIEQAESNEPHNEHRLLFASSPHKGLWQVLELFQKLRKERSNLELGIMNPGYIELENIEDKDGVKVYGVKSHADYMSIMARSALLFYPQTVFPETFGLVLAEANAVYTPVLAHNFGAAREVLSDPRQAIDCTNEKKVVSRAIEILDNNKHLDSLYQMGPKWNFRQECVLKTWEKLIEQDKDKKDLV